MTITFDTSTPVLIFNRAGQTLHHGTLGIIRTLGRLGLSVYSVVENSFTPAALSRYLAEAFVWKTAGLGAEDLRASLAEIGRRLSRPAILIPTDDLGAIFVAEHAEDLKRWFLFPRVPPDLPCRLVNKHELYRLCQGIGAPCPEAGMPTSREDVHAFIEHAKFPVVVKVADPFGMPEVFPSVSIARDAAQLLETYQRAENLEAPNLVFQEYIPASAAEDWIFHGYVNPETGACVAFTGKKLRSYPSFAGPTMLGVSVPNPALAEQAVMLLKSIGYAGVMDLDYRLDRRDGKYKLLDFNPRVGANFRMFENAEGVDVVRAMHLDLTGRPVPNAPQLGGRKLLVESHDLFAAWGYMRNGALTFRAWRHSLKGQKELAWFDGKDPAPALAMCLYLPIRALRRVFRLLFRHKRPHVPRQPSPDMRIASGFHF
jgi:predicted ATP-grasp superfamily ATP-dependent carboligase